MLRANFYIDGYNLYCGLKQAGLYPFIWLNLDWLCRLLVERARETLSSVTYFTALPEHDPGKAERHRVFLSALRAAAPSLEIVLGDFKTTTRRCSQCGREFRHWEEKRTDVAIAVRVTADAFEDRFDCAYLMSADSDLVPAISTLKGRFPSKKIGAWFPPGRHSNDIRKSSDFASTIPDRLVRRCQLPDPVTLPDGRLILKPDKWRIKR